MKKYIFIILAILSVFSCNHKVNAQGKAITMTGSDAATDTITNAGTVYLTSPILDKYTTGKFAISFKSTNVSGTSTFKAILQGSNDGTNWSGIHSVAGTDGINCDTLQVTAAAPSYHTFSIMPGSVHSASSSTFLYTGATRFLYIRVACIGTGTQSTIVSAKIVPFQ